MNWRPSIIPLVLLVVSFFLAIQIFTSEKSKQELKTDLIELSKVKYGLFNVDEWKKVISEILTKKIEEFDLKGANKEVMREKISDLLYEVVEDFEGNYHEQRKNSVKGWLERGVANVTNTFGAIKNEVPKITEDILNFLDKKENRESIKAFIMKKLEDYTDKTFSKVDYSAIDAIQTKYKEGDLVATTDQLLTQISEEENLEKPYKYSILILGVLTCLFILFRKGFSRISFFLYSFLSLVFLFLGVLLPMIELDARISEINFTLLGETVSFSDQVLFYKSKSIMEVFQLLVSQGKIDMILVGILVVTFSVLFPLSKLVASWLYLFSAKWRGKKIIEFLVFKIGKWSMADVMVVAIFMSFIGFSGIVGEQLSQLENIALDLDVLTTNNSKLLFGFFSFTMFVILSLLISHKLRYDGMNKIRP